VRAVDELHGDVGGVTPGADVEDAHDVFVIEAGQGPGLALQAPAVVLSSTTIMVQELQGDAPGELLIPGGVNGAHAA
jgi:hypothetical protein